MMSNLANNTKNQTLYDDILSTGNMPKLHLYIIFIEKEKNYPLVTPIFFTSFLITVLATLFPTPSFFLI